VLLMHKECFTKKGWQVWTKYNKMFVKYNAILAGGTALALHIGHRISEDLDFFTAKAFKVESIISNLRKYSDSFSIMSEGEDFITVILDGVKVSLFKYDYPFIDKISSYKGIRIASINDVASMKIIAINQRGTKRDFIDLFFILQETPFHKIADNMISRFGIDRINPLHIGKSFVYFSDAESNPEPLYIKGKDVNWEKIKIFFRSHTKQFVFDLDTAIKRHS